MATLKDVAEAAGVSIATVSHVLNRSKAISPEVREQVLEAATRLGYRPNRSARTLRTGKSFTIALVVPDLANPYFPELVQAVERSARVLGYALVVVASGDSKENEWERLQMLSEYSVDGVIWVPISDCSHQGALAFPAVVVDRPLAGFDVVYCNHYEGGRLVAEHAIKLGHRRVLLLSGPQALESARMRREGFMAGAAGRLEIVSEQEVPFSVHLPEAAIRALNERNFSLVVGANDVIAIGALRALTKAKVDVPRQVSVLGFDDITWASMVTPQLTTIRQPINDIGSEAVNVLYDRLQDPNILPRETVMPVTLIERESTFTARKRGRE
jgi:LacI family transcriptional regulator